jgi:hypothetical protein
MANRYVYHESYAVIYVLTDYSDNIFYVGCTIRPLAQRLKLHLNEAKGDYKNTNKVKNEKIRSIDYKVLIKEIDRVKGQGYNGYQINAAGRKRETLWMLKYHFAGCNLANCRDLMFALKELTTKQMKEIDNVKPPTTH